MRTEREKELSALAVRISQYAHDENPFEYNHEEELTLAFQTYFDLLDNNLDYLIDYFTCELQTTLDDDTDNEKYIEIYNILSYLILLETADETETCKILYNILDKCI